jgi:hypothetical protein
MSFIQLLAGLPSPRAEETRRGISMLLGVGGGVVLNLLPLQSPWLMSVLLTLLVSVLSLRLVTEALRAISFQIPYILTLGGFLLHKYGLSLESLLLSITIVSTLSGAMGLLLLDKEREL